MAADFLYIVQNTLFELDSHTNMTNVFNKSINF